MGQTSAITAAVPSKVAPKKTALRASSSSHSLRTGSKSSNARRIAHERSDDGSAQESDDALISLINKGSPKKKSHKPSAKLTSPKPAQAESWGSASEQSDAGSLPHRDDGDVDRSDYAHAMDDDDDFDQSQYDQRYELFKREFGRRGTSLRSTRADGFTKVPYEDPVRTKLANSDKLLRRAQAVHKDKQVKGSASRDKRLRESQESSMLSDEHSEREDNDMDMDSGTESGRYTHRIPANFHFSGPSLRAPQDREGKRSNVSDRESTHKPAYDVPVDEGLIKRQRTHYEENAHNDFTKVIHVNNALSLAAPILRSLDSASWKIFNKLWREYILSGGRSRLFASLATTTHIPLCGWLYKNEFINRISLTSVELDGFFRDRKDILAVLQECCEGKKLQKAKSAVQKEYELEYCYPLDLPSENPEPKWSMRILQEREESNLSDQWTVETHLDGLKKCYPELKAKLEARYKSKDPNWELMLCYISADIRQYMADFFRMKAELFAQYRSDLPQMAPHRERGVPTLTAIFALSATKTHAAPTNPKPPAVPIDPAKKPDRHRGHGSRNPHGRHQDAPGTPKDTPASTGIPHREGDRPKYAPAADANRKPHFDAKRVFTKEQTDAYEKRKRDWGAQKPQQHGKRN
jgi:hypothetical protein